MKTASELRSIISQMSLDQKVGALLTLGFNGTLPTPNIYEYVTKFHCGGLRLTPNGRQFGSYVDPNTGKTVVKIADQRYFYKEGVTPPELSAQEYKALLDELQELAASRPLGLPLHYSFDQEGDGPEANCIFKDVKIFPKPMGIRATNDVNLAYEVAKATARQTRAIGFNVIHSPVLDISVEPRNPEVYNRAYSDRAEEVAEWAIAACKGYKDGGVIATGKHFPGRGDSPVDAHFEIPYIDVDKETLLQRELLPYKELIAQDLLPSVMLAHSIYPAIDETNIATVSKHVVTGLLREELGFDGVITTDSMTMGGIATRYGVAQACAMSLEAGADLVLMKAQNSLVDETVREIRDWVETGKISEAELDRKVYRVLSLKNEYGLFDDPIASEKVDDVLRDPHIIELAGELARESLTVVREKAGALPLSRDKEILVIEQLYTNANHRSFHPASLLFHCLKYNTELAYLEIKLKADDEDEARIRSLWKQFDTIIVTNNYGRGTGANTELLNELIAEGDKTVIVIGNTPYALSIPESAENVLMSIGYTSECMQAAAEYLFGEGPAEGVMPVSNGVI